MAPDPPYVFTLVRGTFARGAPWTRQSSTRRKVTSVLRDRLKAAFSEGALTKRVCWSGANSHGARLAAGERLASSLRRSLRRHPRSKHFVLAHSHGGNVVLAALRDPDLQAKVSGVVTMATPFIDCAPRDLTQASVMRWWLPLGAAVMAAAVAASLFVMLGLGLAELFFEQVLGRQMPEWLYVVMILPLALYMPAAIVGVYKWVRSRIDQRLKWAPARQREILARYGLPAVAAPIFCAAVPLDEARAALRIGAGTGEVFFRLWRPRVFLRCSSSCH